MDHIHIQLWVWVWVWVLLLGSGLEQLAWRNWLGEKRRLAGFIRRTKGGKGKGEMSCIGTTSHHFFIFLFLCHLLSSYVSSLSTSSSFFSSRYIYLSAACVRLISSSYPLLPSDSICRLYVHTTCSPQPPPPPPFFFQFGECMYVHMG